MRLTRHRSTYRPWLPDARIIRTRGVVKSTALTVFWGPLVLDAELRRPDATETVACLWIGCLILLLVLQSCRH